MISARKFSALILLAALCAATTPASAQFPFGRQQQPYPPQEQDQGDSDLAIRVDRLEQQLRTLTGQIEQLQFQNQQLQQQLQTRGDSQPPVTQQRPLQPQQLPQRQPNMQQPQTQLPPPVQQQDIPPRGPSQNPQRRGDAFDPDADPNAPGRPRNLGQIQPQNPQGPQGPMVLSPNAPNQNLQGPQDQPPQQQAVLPPSNTPKDAYDLAYGYILRRDFALAEASFKSFIDQYPGDRNLPTATYWYGEALYQQRKYNDAAEVFLGIYNKHPQSPRAPDAILRLGQSLAQLGRKDAACGSFGAVLAKYPKLSPTVRKNAEDEQKRLGC